MICDSNFQRLCSNLYCERCFERSFASHEKAEYWSLNNDISPREVLKKSGKKFIFICEKLGHEYEMTLSKITGENRSCNHPCCSIRKLCKIMSVKLVLKNHLHLVKKQKIGLKKI